MTKIVQALLTGMFFTFFMDFFIFLGLKTNYIDALNIDEYYNVLFADNQNAFLFFSLSIFLGYLVIYRSNKLSLIVMIPLFLLSFTTLIPPVGKALGEGMFKTSNVSLQTKKYTYTGDIIYTSRTEVLFYDKNIKKVLHIDKNKIIGKY
ncbi:hypothetical protein [Sulfurimonas sp.]|jgi:hypothetical protein|uniref:hypothetical protein n=1 Tax=Sulfurimonas sp. TaxID=2022749 RepID=UPI0025F0169E|nr:hypothetical protein [Sulfurimonas sp.]MBT5935920.1 hypothetical protein [Sulfurimonas sp.]